MKKGLLLVLVFCLLMGLFASCSNKNDKTDSGTTESDSKGETSESASILEDITVKDYGGKEYVILGLGDDDGAEKDGNSVSHSYEGGSKVDSVIYQRTVFLEKKYNCEMRYKSTRATYQALLADSMSGGGSYNMVHPHPTEGIASIYTEGLAANIMDMYAIDLDKPWYRESQTEIYTVNGRLYQVASDVSVGSPLDGFVFNKDLYSSLGYTEDLYDIVFEGDWTLEKFYDIVTQYHSGYEGVEESAKIYSLVYHKGTENRFMYGCDQKTVKRNSEDEYELAFEEDKLDTIASYLYNLVYNCDNVYVGECKSENEWGSSEMMNIFTSGRSIFIKYNVGGLYNHLRNLNFRIGYLPMPKYDSNQKNYRVLSTGGGVMIPSALSNEEQQKSAAVLDAFARYNNVYMRPAFYNVVLQGRLSEDERDYQMLELMLEHPIYDIGFMIDGAGTGKMKGILTYVIFSNKSDTVHTYISQNSAIFRSLVNQINSLGNRIN